MKVSRSNKKMLFLFIMAIAAALFSVFYLAYYGNKPQIFTDIVIEYPAVRLLNKSPECMLIFLLCAAGVMFYTFFYIKNSQYEAEKNEIYGAGNTDMLRIISALLTVFAAFVVFYGKISPRLLLFLIPAAIAAAAKRKYAPYVFLLCAFILYALYGGYRLYTVLGGMAEFGGGYFVIAAAVLASVFFAAAWISKNGENILKYACLAAQLFIPLVLLLYLNKNYLYRENLNRFDIPIRVKTAILAVIVVFTAETAAKLAKAVKNGIENIGIINYGTCVSVMAFNRYSGFGVIMPKDLHHSFENIIGYFQIFEQKQIPFKEYIPVSGLYSVIEGGFFKFFGGGIFANYNISQNLFYLFVIMLTVWMLRRRFDGISLFLYSLLFTVSDYSRYIFVLPIMLILSDEKLISNKNTWLKVWFLTSLFHGLYYPLVGAAVCAAFMPLGVFLFVSFVRSGGFNACKKKAAFWLNWILCVLPALLSVKLLWGTYRHIKAMSGQTVYADGLTQFGRSPGDLMAYLDNDGIRLAAGCAMAFVVPAAVVWAGVAAAFKFGNFYVKDGKFNAKDKNALLAGLSIAIMPVIAYTYTFVRLDSMFSRSMGIMYAAVLLMAVFAAKYIKQRGILCALYCFVFFIPACTMDIGCEKNDDKLVPYYCVSDDYEPVENGAQLLGKGYIKKNITPLLDYTTQRVKTLDKTQKYYAVFYYFGDYYLSCTRSCGMIEKTNVKSYDTAEETVEMLRANKPAVGTLFGCYENYYMHHWMLTSGEYIYSPDDLLFFPNTENKPIDEVKQINAAYSEGEQNYKLKNVPSALGTSLFSLMDKCFVQKDVDYTLYDYGDGKIISTGDIYGDDADYIYIKLNDTDTRVSYAFYDDIDNSRDDVSGISEYFYKRYLNKGKEAVLIWGDRDGYSHSYSCAFNNGELLIPLGLDSKWLFDTHNELYIEVNDNGGSAKCEIKDLRFLKLREVK